MYILLEDIIQCVCVGGVSTDGFKRTHAPLNIPQTSSHFDMLKWLLSNTETNDKNITSTTHQQHQTTTEHTVHRQYAGEFLSLLCCD